MRSPITSGASRRSPLAIPRRRSRILRKAIELQPQLAEAYNNRGIIQRTLGDYRQASKDFERAAQLGMELAKNTSRCCETKRARRRSVCGVPG